MIWLALAFVLVSLTVWFTLRPLLVRVVNAYAPPASQPIPSVPVPVDLLLSANGYEQEWARDQALARYRELYQQTGSWDGVRRVMSEQS